MIYSSFRYIKRLLRTACATAAAGAPLILGKDGISTWWAMAFTAILSGIIAMAEKWIRENAPSKK